jgi:hypothetical protein
LPDSTKVFKGSFGDYQPSCQQSNGLAKHETTTCTSFLSARKDKKFLHKTMNLSFQFLAEKAGNTGSWVEVLSKGIDRIHPLAVRLQASRGEENLQNALSSFLGS